MRTVPFTIACVLALSQSPSTGNAAKSTLADLKDMVAQARSQNVLA